LDQINPEPETRNMEHKMPRSTDFKRADRVAELVRSELSQILLRDVKDPSLSTVTVTRVKVTDDLRMARVHYGVLNRTSEVEDIQQGLERAVGYIHTLLGKRLKMRFIPKLTFIFDKNLDYSFHIGKIIEDLDIPEETEPGSDEPADPETGEEGE
jgi:ribosome-binding factor A